MSNASGIRAAAAFADLRRAPPSHTSADRQRVPPTDALPDRPKGAPRSGYGVNAADRRPDRRIQSSGPPLSPTKNPAPRDAPSARPARDLRRRDVDHLRLSQSPARQTTLPGSQPPASQSWTPQAALAPTSSAPLAPRVSTPALLSSAPPSLQPPPMSTMSPVDQEKVVVDDLLFCFMGFEGQYLRFADHYNPSDERDRLIGPSYRVAQGLDPSLRDLAQATLRISKYYVALEAFVEVQSRVESGLVNHALCAAIRKLLKDFLVLVTQLEHQQLTNPAFTLHLLSMHTRSSGHVLARVYGVAQDILKKNAGLVSGDDSDSSEDVDDIIEQLREGADGPGTKRVCKGGAVLGLITNRLFSMSGDPAAKTLLTTLLREASRPYMNMLNEWLHRGAIRDPHGEFFIREQKSIRREGLEQDYTDEYWEKRYTLRDSEVPPQLEAVKDKVLLAGKYLNVVRECGGVDISKEVQDAPLTFDDPRFLENVNDAYAKANSSLLALLLTTHSLPARLRSLKHYFFLDRSDFFAYFLELGASELRKPARVVNVGKLQSLLDLVLRQPGSVAAEDPFKEDVKVCMNEISLTNWLMRVVNVTGLDQDAANTSMTNLLTPAAPAATAEDKDIIGFDAMVLDYMVPFPLSLVISRVTLTRYQLLFRYLLSLRHLETLLAASWNEHVKGFTWKHRSANPKIEQWKRRAWTLRARMMVFVQQLLYFCTAEVIEPNWQALMHRLGEGEQPDGASKAKRTVDELMQDHVDFLATCLKECMLTNSKLLRINAKVINTCTMFANYTSSLSRYLSMADQDLAAGGSKADRITSRHGPQPFDPSKLDVMIETLGKYEYHFSRHLKMLLDMLNYLAATETVVFLSLCARLSTANESAPTDGSKSGNDNR